MNNVSITIDVTKLPREKIVARTFQAKGEEVTAKEIRLEVVELKQHKVLKSYDNADLVKTHFVCVAKTKQERDNSAETVYVGEGVQFIKTEHVASLPQSQPAPQSQGGSAGFDDFNDDLPF